MRLKIQCFGEFRVWREGKLFAASEWKSSRVEDLLKLLAAEPRLLDPRVGRAVLA